MYKCGWFANGVYLKARTDMGNDDNQIQSVGIGNTPFSDKPISTISTMRSVKGLVLTLHALARQRCGSVVRAQAVWVWVPHWEESDSSDS